MANGEKPRRLTHLNWEAGSGSGPAIGPHILRSSKAPTSIT